MKKNKKLFYERARELPSRMRVARGATGVTVRDYAYDSVGRVLSRKTARLGRTVSDSFGYNTRSELVCAVLGASDYAYDFDSIGNRLSSSEAGTALAYSANALNQYSSYGRSITAAALSMALEAAAQTAICIARYSQKKCQEECCKPNYCAFAIAGILGCLFAPLPVGGEIGMNLIKQILRKFGGGIIAKNLGKLGC